ncbi:hypothetical protein HDU97_009115 [Phlyctochytrium planicorne]|nr:hypothetical protein HDU97_009115 [Phlyctochytrium planicorne]
MIWNLAADTSQGDYDTLPFANQVVGFGLSKAFQLSLKTLFDICRSMHAWLSMDDSHVAVVHCINGFSRTSVAISAYLRFADIFEDATEAFDHFVRRRTPDDASWVSVSQRRYIQYFNNVLLLNGSVPTPYPLRLHRVILNGIPEFDNNGSCCPGIEIYQSGKLIYSAVSGQPPPLPGAVDDSEVYMDDQHIIFKSPTTSAVFLEKDIQLRIFHCPDPSNPNSQVITMVNFTFHTGFMPSGLIRVAPKDLELSRKDVEEGRFPREFSLDMILSETVSKVEQENPAEISQKPINYSKFLDRGITRCLARLISYHSVKVDEQLMRSLEELGSTRIMACFALQKTNNNINEAHLFLVNAVTFSGMAAKAPRSSQTGQRRPSKDFPPRSQVQVTLLPPAQSYTADSTNLPPVSAPEKKTYRNITPPETRMLQRSATDPFRLKSSTPEPKQAPMPERLSSNSYASSSGSSTSSNVNASMKRLEQLLERTTSPTRQHRRVDRSSDGSGRESPHPQNHSDSRRAHKQSPLEELLGQLRARRGVSPLPPSPTEDPLAMMRSSSEGSRQTKALSPARRKEDVNDKELMDLKKAAEDFFGSGDLTPSTPTARSRSSSAKPQEKPQPWPRANESNSQPASVPVLAPPPPPVQPSKPETEGTQTLSRKAKLQWDELRDDAPKADSGDISDAKKRQTVGVDGKELDVTRFEELFIVPTATSKKVNFGAPKLVQLAQFTTVLDLRRANNVAIGLSRYSRRNMNSVDIADAVVKLDDKKLNADDLISIQSLLPTKNEIEMLEKAIAKQRQNPQALPFAPAESFMIEMMNIPDMPKCVAAFTFKSQLGPEIEEVGGKIAKMTSVCIKLKTSDSLKTMLRAVFQLGNLSNQEYGAGNSSYRPWMGKEARSLGFKIEGLARLKDVKSADGKWSLMNFLVDMVTQSKPEVLDFTEEFADLKIIRHYDLRELSSQLLAMDQKLASIRLFQYQPDIDFGSRIKPFLDQAAAMIAGLRLDFETFAKAWIDASRYFGEDLEEYSPIVYQMGAKLEPEDTGNEYDTRRKKVATHLFVSLDVFMRAFEDAVKQNRRRVEEERARIKKEAALAEEKRKRDEARQYKERMAEIQRQHIEQQQQSAGGVLAALFAGASIAPMKPITPNPPVEVALAAAIAAPVPVDRTAALSPTPDYETFEVDPITSSLLTTENENEAKEMMKRFSVMQTLPPGEDEDDDNEEGLISDDGMGDVNAGDGIGDYDDDGVQGDLNRLSQDSRALVCNRCFLTVDECECKN